MVDSSRRKLLTHLPGGALAVAFSESAFSGASFSDAALGTSNTSEFTAYDSAKAISGVSITISTLSKGSAVFTIKNNTDLPVRISKIHPSIVSHEGTIYNVQSALGKNGVPVKAGRRTILALQTTTNKNLLT